MVAVAADVMCPRAAAGADRDYASHSMAGYSSAAACVVL